MESRQRQFEMALQTINKFYNDLSDTERKKIGSSGIWSDGHNLHYINSKHDDVQLRTIGNSLIFSCSIFVES